MLTTRARWPRLAAAGVAAIAGASAMAGPVRAAPAPPEMPQRTILTQVFGAIESGDSTRARRLSGELRGTGARTAARWFVMVERTGGGTFARYRRFLNEHPDWPRRETLRHRAEGALPGEASTEAIAAYFAEYPPVTAYGAERYAGALRGLGREEQAESVLRRAWRTESFNNGGGAGFYERHHELFSANAYGERLDRLIWQRRLDAAERQLWRVDEAYRRLGIARIRLARMAYGVDEAIAKVPERLADRPALQYERARWRRMKQRFDDTVAMLTRADGVKRPRRWWPIRRWAARTALDKGHVSTAYRLAAHHGLDDGIEFAQAAWLAGFVALRYLRDSELALDHFERLHAGVTTPVSLARAAYWAGRAANSHGETGTARSWYQRAATKPTTYYGQLAAQRLGDDVVRPALPEGPAITPERRLWFNAREPVAAVRAFARLGHTHRTDPLIRYLSRTADDPAGHKLVAGLAASVGRGDLAVQHARRARSEGVVLPNHLYPDPPWPALADGAATTRDALTYAVARQESSFQPGAKSADGALGLMQLLPGTARRSARRLNIPFERDRLTAEPSYNLKLGQTYLDSLLSRYDGARVLAIAAYNAGPGTVNRWIDRYGDPRTPFITPVAWLARIPYVETRSYAQRVLETMMVRRHRAAPRKVALTLDETKLLGERRGTVYRRAGETCCL